MSISPISATAANLDAIWAVGTPFGSLHVGRTLYQASCPCPSSRPAPLPNWHCNCRNCPTLRFRFSNVSHTPGHAFRALVVVHCYTPLGGTQNVQTHRDGAHCGLVLTPGIRPYARCHYHAPGHTMGACQAYYRRKGHIMGVVVRSRFFTSDTLPSRTDDFLDNLGSSGATTSKMALPEGLSRADSDHELK